MVDGHDALCSDVKTRYEATSEKGRRNEGRSQYHVFYALVHGVTQEIDYLRKCEEKTVLARTDVESHQPTNHEGTVVGCVSEYDTQHRVPTLQLGSKW